MKIEKLDIIGMCNLSHPDFGVFISFLDGLSKGKSYIEVPYRPTINICDDCYRPLWLETSLCLFCLGMKEAHKKNPILDCKHTWTLGKERDHCIKCGVFMNLVDNPLNKQS